MSKIIQASILPGFMELLPNDQVEFDHLKMIVEEEFKKFGYFPLDTPLIEKRELLLSKGGGETSKQIYNIENKSTDQSLRFDLTVPLARYVAMNENELAFPFKRYQIAKVYRGERNQRGRFREFYQADIDIVGRDKLSIYNDAEIPYTMYKIFKRLKIKGFSFHINNRKLLNGFLNILKIDDKEECLRTMDKMAKIGEDKVREILGNMKINEEKQDIILSLFEERTNEETLEFLDNFNKNNKDEVFAEGIQELKLVYLNMKAFGIEDECIKIDLGITRGLDYYTGSVYETFITGLEEVGSVCSGGRYENLASNFTKKTLPGIGLSIGLTRLYFILKEQDMIDFQEDENYIKALIIPMSEDKIPYAIDIVNLMRDKGVNSQIYFESGKMKKKFTYADKIKAKYAITIGEEEVKTNSLSIKNLTTGNQEKVAREDLIIHLNKN